MTDIDNAPEGGPPSRKLAGALALLKSEWPILVIWLSFAIATAIGSALAPQSIGTLGSFAVLAVIFAIMLTAVFRVVHHAECLAEIFGEPLGTLILTLAVIGIEVALITAVMLNGENNPTLARDTMFSVLMIVLNGLVGLSLLIGGLRHGLQAFNLSGANAYLVVLLAISVSNLVLPRFTESAPGGGLSSLQMLYAIVASLFLYGVFLTYQTLGQPGIFRQPAASETAEVENHAHGVAVRSVSFHVAALALALLPLVLMSKKLAVYVNFGVEQVGAPIALGGFLVAIMILTPEGMAALDAARRNQLQRAVNVCLGSALSTIGLTVPAVLIASLLIGRPIELGLDTPEIALLLMTLAISIVTFLGSRTNALQGVVHLFVFLTYVVLIFDR